MQEFNRLVAKQVQTMDRLLFLQSELERCQEIENVLKELQQESQVASVQLEITIQKLGLSILISFVFMHTYF